ncbi:MAG: TrkH family potassium uptake protein [Acidimicrobiia bacterium]
MARRLAFIIGAVIGAAGVTMVPSALVSLLYGERVVAGQIVLAAGLTMGIGWLLWRWFGRQGVITTKEGFAAVGLAWFALSAFGMLPYLLTGSIPSITNSFFETTSGFTTTGASILPDPGLLPKGVLFWRSTTQWIGGMGVIVLSIAILPLLGAGGVQLARAESPGPAPDRLTPRFQETAKRLWLLYAAITLVQVLLLWAGDMDLFESINHSFATMSTGGFGVRADSIGGYSAYSQWVIAAFMFIAGASFTLHYRALRGPSAYLGSTEFILYTAICAAAIVVVAGGLFGPGVAVGTAIRDSTFTVLSIITTTGFATADFAQWRPALQILIVGLMFIGGMAGSTAGGVKVFRVGILSKAARADVRRLVHPKGVFVVRFGKNTLRDDVVEGIQSFFLFYMFIFMSGTFLLSFIDANAYETLDLITSASAVASALGNIGPGLGDVGPISNYLSVPAPGRWLLGFLMIVGRLEIFPIALLFTRDLWRR